ncbi:MAG: DUF177 domain-containing protein [Bacillota bacterium]
MTKKIKVYIITLVFWGVNMIIHLPDIKSKPGEALNYSFQVELDDYYDDFPEGGKVKINLNASYSEGEVLINGSFEASITAYCSRCLEPFVQVHKANFNELFTVVQGEFNEEASATLAEEAANRLIVSGDNLYLEEYIRQLIIVTQEYRPLCKPDCKGICDQCGTDLNQSSCQCNKDEDLIDVRLLKLKEYYSGD